MTKEELLNGLIQIHNRYSSDRYYADENAQFCTMWPLNDPPDVLVGTDPLEAVCDLIDMDIDEDLAMELFDMTLGEAVDALWVFMVEE